MRSWSSGAVVMFMVHRAEIDYVRPAVLDDLLVVETQTHRRRRRQRRAAPDWCAGPEGSAPSLRIKLACVANRRKTGTHPAPMARGDGRHACEPRRRRTAGTRNGGLEAVDRAVDAVNLGTPRRDLSLWGLFVQADIVVKLVMIGLLAASIWVWAVVFEKVDHAAQG